MSVQDRHFTLVAARLAEGRVIPFLGAGASLADRPEQVPWEDGPFLPTGGELAHALAKSSVYPDPADLDLARVSQYVGAVLGEGELYRQLHQIFDADYSPSSVHGLLARLPKLLRSREMPQLVMLTTNYDDLIERAFKEAGEDLDVVWYEAKDGEWKGRFLHRAPTGDVARIEFPNEYEGLALAKRPALLKLHGAVDRGDTERKGDSKRDSYVVTEDSYIDYLAGRDVGEQQIPWALRERIAESHLLFLGYSMRDWNLRVILNRIWGPDRLDLKSWAIQREPPTAAAREIEETLWRARGDVDPEYIGLKEYVERLDAALTAMTAE